MTSQKKHVLTLKKVTTGFETWFDFCIDGKSLRPRLRFRDNSWAEHRGLLGRFDGKTDNIVSEELRTGRSTTLESGRVPLYVCPICADVGCGAVTTRITKSGDTVVWDDFTHETGIDDVYPPYPLNPRIKFQFDASSYEALFSDFA